MKKSAEIGPSTRKTIRDDPIGSSALAVKGKPCWRVRGPSGRSRCMKAVPVGLKIRPLLARFSIIKFKSDLTGVLRSKLSSRKFALRPPLAHLYFDDFEILVRGAVPIIIW